jgi:hypothetical protein
MQFIVISFKTKYLADTELGAGTTWYYSYLIEHFKKNYRRLIWTLIMTESPY